MRSSHYLFSILYWLLFFHVDNYLCNCLSVMFLFIHLLTHPPKLIINLSNNLSIYEDKSSIPRVAVEWKTEGRTVEAEATAMGHSWGTLWTLAQDRRGWREYVAALVVYDKKGSKQVGNNLSIYTLSRKAYNTTPPPLYFLYSDLHSVTHLSLANEHWNVL